MDGDYYEAPLLWPRQHIHGDAVIHSRVLEAELRFEQRSGVSYRVTAAEKFEVK